jgi:hypothetical protein
VSTAWVKLYCNGTSRQGTGTPPLEFNVVNQTIRTYATTPRAEAGTLLDDEPLLTFVNNGTGIPTATVLWGDDPNATPETASITNETVFGSHTYLRPGAYMATVTLQFEDSYQSCDWDNEIYLTVPRVRTFVVNVGVIVEAPEPEITATPAQTNPGGTVAAGSLFSITQLLDSFSAGDVNLYRYVGNGVTGATDPSGLAKTKVEIPLTLADKEILDAVNSVVAEMEEEGWRPRNPENPGEFGTILHRRVAVKLKESKHWMLNVYVENGTNKILSVGVHPGGGGHTEVDALSLKEGVAKPKAGDILDPNEIEGIYDVKTSSTGSIPLDQRRRLKAIRSYGTAPAGIDDSVKSVRSNRRWSAARSGFVDSPRIKNVLRLFSVLGVAGYVGGVLDTDAHAREMDEVLKEAGRIRGMQLGSQERMLATSLWLMGPVRTYLARIVPDDKAVNIAVGVGVRQVLRDFIDPLKGGDPCADEPN